MKTFQSITLKSNKKGGGRGGSRGQDLTTVFLLYTLYFAHPYLGQTFSCKARSLVKEKYYFHISSDKNLVCTYFIQICCSAILTFCFLEPEHEFQKIIVDMQALKFHLLF